eukprot:9965942-Alexandrium_andersonii.AAC.1
MPDVVGHTREGWVLPRPTRTVEDPTMREAAPFGAASKEGCLRHRSRSVGAPLRASAGQGGERGQAGRPSPRISRTEDCGKVPAVATEATAARTSSSVATV